MWSIIDFSTINLDSAGSNTIFTMSKLRSFEAKSILGFLWSPDGHKLGRGGLLFVFKERFRFSASEYPFSMFKLPSFEVNCILVVLWSVSGH